MADESFDLEDGEVVVGIAAAVNGPSSSSSAADDNYAQFRAQLDEATQSLIHQGQLNLARLARALVHLHLRDAMWVLNDGVRGGGGEFSGDPALFDAFRRSIRRHLLNLQETGYEEHHISATIPHLVLWIAQLAAAGLLRIDDDDDATQQVYINVGAVPASIAAVRCLLEKQTFRAGDKEKKESVAEGGGCSGITECSICFEEFVDGVQVSVMPCPSSLRGHRFHSDCIVKWLRISNTCPLCRHVLPAYGQ